jgi:N-formylglutamate deformylase
MDLPIPQRASIGLDPTDLAYPAAATGESPIRILAPLGARVPVVFASPHSGKNYPPAFLAAARLDPLALRRSEDSFVDELFGAAPAHGAPLLLATFPRAWCDPNREAWELDPAMFEDPLPAWVNSRSPRVQAGLGTIARIVSSGEPIYRTKLRFAEAEHRVQAGWRPYHDALDALITETVASFGACLVIDCHSMPGPGSRPGRSDGPAFVLGDAHGTSCNPRITGLTEECLTGFGYRVRRNDPYAGGYTTRHYGHPRAGVHVLQVEVARALYMDEVRIEKLGCFASLQAELTQVVATLTGAGASLLSA